MAFVVRWRGLRGTATILRLVMVREAGPAIATDMKREVVAVISL